MPPKLKLQHSLQRSARTRVSHGLQCGFCTPGSLMTTVAFLRENPGPREEQIHLGLSGNLSRRTGYQNIVGAVNLAAQKQRLAHTPGDWT